ncbi:MAG: pyridine nucleotide-disulfide oxidoreductase [Rhizobiaceae bacterium]|nr:pyridine nucleotide-disulfide oxidoreductase [Rhizobiaceae bacterium]
MKHVTTIIIGAGQAGLAMSKQLTDRSIDHVLLERGAVANSWKTERWNSLRLLTPNWQSRLPGYRYTGNDPDGFMDMKQVVSFLDGYASTIAAPVEHHTKVLSVERRFDSYVIKTTRGIWSCASLVLANGACAVPVIPKCASAMPETIQHVSPLDYKSPDQLPQGGVLVVGASATGVQLAREIHQSSRPVTLSVGEHIRLPRIYRGHDIKWWMDALGLLDMGLDEVEDLSRARKLSSLQLIGSDNGTMLDINHLRSLGVDIAGRLAGINNGKAQFSGSLSNICDLADLKMGRLLDSIDEYATQYMADQQLPPPHRYAPTDFGAPPNLQMALNDGRINTVVWATGFRPDYSWLDLPVLDRKGNLNHTGGIVDAPGLYALGLPFMRTRKSTLIDGVGDDAAYLADHLRAGLHRRAA